MVHVIICQVLTKLTCVPPILTAYHELSKRKRAIVDSIVATDGTRLNWRMMQYVLQHVDDLDYLVGYHNAGMPGGRCVILSKKEKGGIEDVWHFCAP